MIVASKKAGEAAKAGVKKTLVGVRHADSYTKGHADEGDCCGDDDDDQDDA